jgi:serine/threonine protein phosphatase PrpC
MVVSVRIFLQKISEEAQRIMESKGRVFCMEDEPGVYRVWMPNGKTPGLAISRAFGDYCVKDFGLISVPDVTQRKLTSMDQFVILATDGVCILFPFNFFFLRRPGIPCAQL